MIFGDLNTMAHSIARLSPKYCTDNMRYRSIGWSEADWFEHHVLDVDRKDGQKNTKLERYRLPEDVVRNCRNHGFFDPFDTSTITLVNYWGLYRGKLDWTLLRGFRVNSKGLKNESYTASDHKLLILEICPSVVPEEHRKHHRTRKNKMNPFLNLIIFVLTVIVALWTIFFGFK